MRTANNVLLGSDAFAAVRVALEIYDEMAHAALTGQPCRVRPDPLRGHVTTEVSQ